MLLSSSRYRARVAALLLSLYCLIAAAAESPGWLLVFDTSQGRFAETTIVATERFEPGHAADVDGASRIVLYDEADRLLYAAPIAVPRNEALRHAGPDANRLAVRVPALPQATRIDVVDAGGGVAWSRRIDADFRAGARRAADGVAAKLELAQRSAGKASSEAIATVATLNERRRRDERTRVAAAFEREPTAENWRRLDTLLRADAPHAPYRPVTIARAADRRDAKTAIADSPPASASKAGPVITIGAPITYRGRILGEDGAAIGTAFRAQIEMPGGTRAFQVDADGRYAVESDIGTAIRVHVEPPLPYPEQRLFVTVDTSGKATDARLARGWVLQGRVVTSDGAAATGAFKIVAEETDLNGPSDAGTTVTDDGRYAIALRKGSTKEIALIAQDLANPQRYLSGRSAIGRIDGDRSVDVTVDPGLMLPVRPLADDAMPDVEWRVGCIGEGDFSEATGTGGATAMLRVRPGVKRSCYFLPAAPYLSMTYADLRFDSGQILLPALRRGHRVSVTVGGEAGSNYTPVEATTVDGAHAQGASSFTNWSAVVGDGSVLMNYAPFEGLLPAAIGPRRFERDERIDLAPRRGSTVTGTVALETPIAWRSTAYGTLSAYRAGDGALVQSTTITEGGAYYIALPHGTYDFRAEFFEDPSYAVLHLAPAERRGIVVASDTTVNLVIPAPARTVTANVSWPDCDKNYLSNVVLRQNGRLLGRPRLGAQNTSCDAGVRTAKSVMKIAQGDYELRLEPEGTAATPWRRLDVRDTDATLDFAIEPTRIWRPKLVDEARRPVEFSDGVVIDTVSHYRRTLSLGPDGRLEIPVVDGWHVLLWPPAGGRLLPARVAFDAAFDMPDELVFKALPPAVDDAGSVRTILASDRAEPLRVLIIGDGYVAERETFTDTNGNGVWDGYAWYDGDGDGVWRNNARDRIDAHGAAQMPPPEGSDPRTLSEPFVDANGDGVPNVDDASLFYANVNSYLRDWFGADYWSQRRGDFEVKAAFLASPQAGSSLYDASGATLYERRTLFGAGLESARGIILIDRDKAMTAAERLAPGYDVLVILINEPLLYGRANATIGTLPSSIVAYGGHHYAGYQTTPIAHEAGHAIGWLGDEYTDMTVEGGVSDVAEPVEPNVSGRAVRDEVEWKDLIAGDAPIPSTYTHDGIGLFPGARYYLGGAFRPSWNSIMRVGTRFDAVGRRALDERFKRLFQSAATPPSGNWYDRRRAGHGVDLQLFRRDPEHGDIYFVVFYTYDDSGKPEWYQALGRISGGLFVPIADPNGTTLTRVRGAGGGTPAAASGDFAIDFAHNEACRTDDRADARGLAAMRWSVGGRAALWCIEPAVARSAHASPDFSGHWFAPADPGWGMEVTAIDDGDGTPTLVAFLYYVDASGQPRWASASTGDFASGQPLVAYEADNGYCRTCNAPATRTQAPIGRITLTLAAATREDPPGGANRIDVDIAPPGGGAFRKTDVPITLLSEPPQ
jgi:hypothetical protein